MAIDGDDPKHISWIFHKAQERAEEYNISGVTYRLTQGQHPDPSFGLSLLFCFKRNKAKKKEEQCYWFIFVKLMRVPVIISVRLVVAKT